MWANRLTGTVRASARTVAVGAVALVVCGLPLVAQAAYADGNSLVGRWDGHGADRSRQPVTVVLEITSTGPDTYHGEIINPPDDRCPSLDLRVTGTGPQFTGTALAWRNDASGCIAGSSYVTNVVVELAADGKSLKFWDPDGDAECPGCGAPVYTRSVTPVRSGAVAAGRGAAGGGAGDWWKWLAGIGAAILATAAAYWARQLRRAARVTAQAKDAVLASGPFMGPLQEVPGITPAARVGAGAVSVASTMDGMVTVTTGSIDILYNAGQSQLSLTAVDYADDPVRQGLVAKILASGDKGAVIKAANLVRETGSASVTPEQLTQIIHEFGLR